MTVGLDFSKCIPYLPLGTEYYLVYFIYITGQEKIVTGSQKLSLEENQAPLDIYLIEDSQVLPTFTAITQEEEEKLKTHGADLRNSQTSRVLFFATVAIGFPSEEKLPTYDSSSIRSDSAPHTSWLAKEPRLSHDTASNMETDAASNMETDAADNMETSAHFSSDGSPPSKTKKKKSQVTVKYIDRKSPPLPEALFTASAPPNHSLKPASYGIIIAELDCFKLSDHNRHEALLEDTITINEAQAEIINALLKRNKNGLYLRLCG